MFRISDNIINSASSAKSAESPSIFGDIMGAVGTIGQILGGQSAANEARGAQDRQMQFQERMRNTQHQAEVADLRAAGLNPILSANKGADVPGGASMSIINPMEGASSAISAQRQLALQGEMQKSQIALNAMNAQNAGASAQQTKAMTAPLAIKAGAEAALATKDLDHKDRREWMNTIKQATGSVGDVVGMVSPFVAGPKAAAEVLKTMSQQPLKDVTPTFRKLDSTKGK